MENSSKKAEWTTPEQRWGKQWDLFLVSMGALGCLYIASLWGRVIETQYKLEAHDRMSLSILFMALSIFFLIKILSYIDIIVRRRWLHSYVIDGGETNVLKVFGQVGFFDTEHVERKLLSLRGGYQIVQNSRELYGCTMAAVPAGNNQNRKSGL